MKERNPITGFKFGRLTVIEPLGNQMYRCKCDCGNVIKAFRSNLTSGRQVSCGCYAKENLKNRMTTHGMSNSKIYRVWRGIINRCENPNHKDYARYGGRGVRVCDEWKTFDGFYKWAQGSGYAEGLQIDRTDNDGDYRPDNCRWITQLENENNRRDTVFIEYNGERISLSNLARKTGINRSTLYDRLFKYGFTLQEAISLPVKVGNNKSLRGGRK